MGETERIPKPGEIYRHFKNKLYQIVAVAAHTETGEELVVYQALYGGFKVYARPLSMFMSPVDKNKYPDAAQSLRFELVMPETLAAEAADTGEDDKTAAKPHPLLMEFLEAEDLGQQIESLKRMRGKIGQKELDSIYVVLDMIPSQGEPDIQLSCLIKALETRKKYDGSRLR